MAEIGLTSAWTLDNFKVAIAKYISSPPMSDTNLKEITASLKWEDCKSLFEDRIMGGEGLLLEIFNKFVNELKEKEHKRQEDKVLKLLQTLILLLLLGGGSRCVDVIVVDIVLRKF
ncbi:uncharacterized protein LOC107853771 [Capsicum annuum]|uniref:uncharacterized protein LOC107853771 n=1 Tax=Capsicum annuum TaxID=4072 RepID=UPI001FB0C976|nr:uncharacterized protein LOC107853771 [Capsicum annuum]